MSAAQATALLEAATVALDRTLTALIAGHRARTATAAVAAARAGHFDPKGSGLAPAGASTMVLDP